jgi:nicotinamide-nucleotide amidase
MHDDSLIATTLGQLLGNRQWTITTAESCTGGGIASVITSVDGSSAWFEQGFITYSNSAKQQQLGIAEALLIKHGAVSEAVVIAMATGARKKANANVAIAVSGVAGPGGGSTDKPVGTVWLAWAIQDAGTVAKCYQFKGGRDAVRAQAVTRAIDELNKALSKNAV